MENLDAVFEQLSEDVGDFWVPPTNVKVLTNPTPEEFMRECVAANEPCIIRGALNH